jgi:metallophosphoesterase (TIGR00282 family)
MENEKTITVLFIADVVGQAGCEILAKELSELKKKYLVDLTIANGENANNNGKGITDKIAKRFFDLGVDVITGGNHSWENRNHRELFESEPRVLRPANYPEGNPGNGHYLLALDDQVKIAVLNLQGRTFLYPIQCPFLFADKFVDYVKKHTHIIIVDFHAEATAEKIALGWYLDGKVSGVIGTHTHVQTADDRILPKGTAYITDVGMTGAHDSVIGTKTEHAIRKFIHQTPVKFEIATDNPRLSGVVLKIDSLTGKAKSISRISTPYLA